MSERKISDVKEIILHHDVCPVEWTIWDISAVDYKRIYLEYGMSHSGHFKDGREVFYGYHWLIHPDGTVEKMLNDDEVGYHCGNLQVNKWSIAIAFHGTYTDTPPNDKMIKACAQLIKQYNLPYRFHKDVVGTICPGNWDRKLIDDAMIGLNHAKQDYGFELLNQSEHPTVFPGETFNLSLHVRNTGKLSWKPNCFKIGTSNSKDRPSLFYNKSWIGINRPCTVDKEVASGEEYLFNISMTAPDNSKGEYKEYFCPLVEDVAWMNDIGIYTLIKVKK